jgi:hypothetical protein
MAEPAPNMLNESMTMAANLTGPLRVIDDEMKSLIP